MSILLVYLKTKKGVFKLMPFKKVNIQQEVNKRIKEDKELEKEYMHAQAEYQFIKSIVEIRNSLGISQSEIAKKVGLTQQMVSRIETVDSSPTLKNFLRYIDGLGLQIKIEKPDNKKE